MALGGDDRSNTPYKSLDSDDEEERSSLELLASCLRKKNLRAWLAEVFRTRDEPPLHVGPQNFLAFCERRIIEWLNQFSSQKKSMEDIQKLLEKKLQEFQHIEEYLFDREKRGSVSLHLLMQIGGCDNELIDHYIATLKNHFIAVYIILLVNIKKMSGDDKTSYENFCTQYQKKIPKELREKFSLTCGALHDLSLEEETRTTAEAERGFAAKTPRPRKTVRFATPIRTPPPPPLDDETVDIYTTPIRTAAHGGELLSPVYEDRGIWKIRSPEPGEEGASLFDEEAESFSNQLFHQITRLLINPDPTNAISIIMRLFDEMARLAFNIGPEATDEMIGYLQNRIAEKIDSLNREELNVLKKTFESLGTDEAAVSDKDFSSIEVMLTQSMDFFSSTREKASSRNIVKTMIALTQTFFQRARKHCSNEPSPSSSHFEEPTATAAYDPPTTPRYRRLSDETSPPPPPIPQTRTNRKVFTVAKMALCQRLAIVATAYPARTAHHRTGVSPFTATPAKKLFPPPTPKATWKQRIGFLFKRHWKKILFGSLAFLALSFLSGGLVAILFKGAYLGKFLIGKSLIAKGSATAHELIPSAQASFWTKFITGGIEGFTIPVGLGLLNGIKSGGKAFIDWAKNKWDEKLEHLDQAIEENNAPPTSSPSSTRHIRRRLDEDSTAFPPSPSEDDSVESKAPDAKPPTRSSTARRRLSSAAVPKAPAHHSVDPRRSAYASPSPFGGRI